MIPGHFLSSGVRTGAFTLCSSPTLPTVEYASEIHHQVKWVAIYGAEEMLGDGPGAAPLCSDGLSVGLGWNP